MHETVGSCGQTVIISIILDEMIYILVDIFMILMLSVVTGRMENLYNFKVQIRDLCKCHHFSRSKRDDVYAGGWLYQIDNSGDCKGCK